MTTKNNTTDIHTVDQAIGLFASLREEIPKGQHKLLLLLAFLSVLMISHRMATSGMSATVANLVRDLPPLVILSWGGGLLLAAGKVDVSIAGIATLCGIIFAALTQWLNVTSIPALSISTIAGMLIGACIGATNGYLVARRRAPALLATWAVGTIAFSIAGAVAAFAHKQGMLGSTASITLPGLIPVFSHAAEEFYFSLAAVALVAVTVIVFRLGWLARLLGSNETGAVYSGFFTERVLLLLFAASGAIAALAGCLFAIGIWASSTTMHAGKEMIALAIAVLGGTVMSGGYFSLIGISISALFWLLLTYLITGTSTGMGVEDGRILSAAFAALIILVCYPLGRSLSGEFRTIHSADETNRTR